MKILKVYDTMQRAKFEAEKHYQEWLNCDMKVRFITPYRIKVGEDVYMFVGKQANILGQRFDKIDDCTTYGIPDIIRMCEYPHEFEKEYECIWGKEG
jgi:hypothetical protein